jgi:hypothetical protein
MIFDFMINFYRFYFKKWSKVFILNQKCHRLLIQAVVYIISLLLKGGIVLVFKEFLYRR